MVNAARSQTQKDRNAFRPRYDLSREDIRYAVRGYFKRPHIPRTRFVGVVAKGDEEISNVGRWLERQVFEDVFGHDANEMVKLYRVVEGPSCFLLVLDRRSLLPAGVMRLVGGKAAYRLTLAEAPDHIPYSAEEIRYYHKIREGEKAWDVVTMAIAKPYRGKVFSQVAVSGILERMFGMEGDRQGIEHVFTMLDAKARKSLDAVGIPLREMHDHPNSFAYKNSPATFAMYGRYAEFRPSMSKRHKDMKQEMLLVNVARMGWRRALRRRVAGRVAGMAAHGVGGVDKHIAPHSLKT